MRDLTDSVEAELSKSANVPITLYTLTPITGAIVRLAEYDRDVYFGGFKYDAFPVSHDSVKNDLESTIDSVRVVVSNGNLFMSALLLHNDGFRGARVKIDTVFANLLEDSDNFVTKFDGVISAVSVTDEVVSFDVVSKLDLQDLRIPKRFFRRDICQWIYKGSGTCQYAGILPTCDKTIDGYNGCRIHMNVQNFGGFPAIPEKRTIIV